MKTLRKWLSHILTVCLCLSLLALVGCDMLPEGLTDLFGDNGPAETPEHEHTPVYHEAKAPTCTEDGWLEYQTCSGCEEYTTFTAVPALGHAFSEEYLANGDHHSRFCLRCTASIDDEHIFREGAVLTEPTCILGGSQSYYCTVCGATKAEDIAPLGHDYSEDYVSTSEMHSNVCTRCDSAIDAAHEWVEGDYVSAPTCDSAGVQLHVCSVCSYTKQVSVDALGHNYGIELVENGSQHGRQCTACGSFTDLAAHELVAGEILEPPTCSKVGIQLYNCVSCPFSTTFTLDEIDHEYSDTYVPNGEVHSRYCLHCDASLDAPHDMQLDRVVTAPSCATVGTELYACRICGDTEARSIPATGEHIDGEWETLQAATATVSGREQLRCAVCNNVINERLIPCDAESMPIMYLNGNYWQATKDKNEVAMTFSYVAPDGTSYEGGATIKVQGATSINYAKKNYTIKLYKDETLEKKQKIDLGWGKESKYVLKANWVDAIQARNIVSCRLWGDMVACRTVSENQARLAALPTNGGAIDGFPVAVYMNGEFYGLYTLNVPKDEWLFGMDDSETEAILCADDWVNTDFSVLLTEFKENAAGDLVANNGGWELKYCGTDDTSWVTESFNNLILFCQQKDGAEFKEGISQYLDVDAAIDYLIYMYVVLMRDNTSKNMNWVTYDGVTWIPSVYDQDGTFGMVWDGKRYATGNSNLPSVKDGVINVGFALGNGYFVLWDKLWNNFTEEILLRYMELRQGVLSYDNIVAEFEAFRAEIPESIYQADIEYWAKDRADWWKGDTYNGVADYFAKFNYEYIYTWQAERLTYLDNAIRNIYNSVYLPGTDNPAL